VHDVLSVAEIVPGHFALEQLPGSLHATQADSFALVQSRSITPQPQSQMPSP
jgi:hypothetical protein